MPPRIPGLPAGWRVLQFKQGVNHPRDAVVLCQREQENDSDANFVCWLVNMVEGGCSAGLYSVTEGFARQKFNFRSERIR
jgi:hypothetical protein